MDFEWPNAGLISSEISTKEIEESFEDPFCIRLLPDLDEAKGREARYFILGRSISNLLLFTVFWTDGKRYRVIFSRLMSPDEQSFYERKNSEMN